MRTNIDIDAGLLKRAMELSESKTKKDAIVKALEFLVKLKSQENLRLLRGKVKWTGNLRKMRGK